MKSIIVGFAFGSLLLFGILSLQAESVLKQVELSISGMTCEGCASGAQFSLEQLEGVVSASISYADSKGVVVYNPEQVTPEQMIQVINDTGYGASVLRKPVAYDGNLEKNEKQGTPSHNSYGNMVSMGYGMMGGNCSEQMSSY